METEKCEACDGTGKQIDQKKFGARMRTRRESACVSLRNAAIAMEISAPYLSDLELGRRHWNSTLIAKFEKALKKRI